MHSLETLLWPDDVENTVWGCLGHIISSFTIQTLLPRAWLIAATSPSLFSMFKVPLRMLSLYFLMKLLVEKRNPTGLWTELPCSVWQSWTCELGR